MFDESIVLNSLSCEVWLNCICPAVNSISLSSFEGENLLVGVSASANHKIGDIIEFGISSFIDFSFNQFLLAWSHCRF